MSYVMPAPGTYRRLSDGATVEVIGCTGIEWNDEVAVRASRLIHVRLENFWKKYQPVEEVCTSRTIAVVW